MQEIQRKASVIRLAKEGKNIDQIRYETGFTNKQIRNKVAAYNYANRTSVTVAAGKRRRKLPPETKVLCYYPYGDERYRIQGIIKESPIKNRYANGYIIEIWRDIDFLTKKAALFGASRIFVAKSWVSETEF